MIKPVYTNSPAEQGATAHRVGSGRGMQLVQVALPCDLNQIGRQPLRERHDRQTPNLRRICQEYQRLPQRQLCLPRFRQHIRTRRCPERLWNRLVRRQSKNNDSYLGTATKTIPI